MIFDNRIIYILITLLVSAAGGLIFRKLKIPAGAMLGAMFFSMLISIIGVECFIPKFVLIVFRIIVGTLLGCRISRQNFLSLKRLFVPMLFFTFLLLSLSLFSGFVISSITKIDQATAFFGSAPGGVMDMPFISSEFGADMSTVAILQAVRLVFCISVIPFIAKRYGNKNLEDKKMNKEMDAYRNEFPSQEETSTNYKTTRFLTAILIGTTGGLVGIILSIPAGALIGAFVFIGIFNIIFFNKFNLFIPVRITYALQILGGAVIGSGMTLADFLGLKKIIVPALMVAIFLLSISISLGFLLNKIWKVNIITALLATAPGGTNSMSLIALDLGADVSIVTSLQFMRLVAMITVYPIVMKIIL